ncbi:unnamed protein product [Clonostachys byssicola]|uniref:Uncharacterized protein n=1 Tax=Clonostachys byssicola TaxID=160290 RepID=A0A9N9UKM3_9HYPO|nr:unnamed protein product [Clonostachys byssicola]
MSPKKNTGSENKREAAGPVPSESLAAESYREGGAFAENVGAHLEDSNTSKSKKKSESSKLDAASSEGYRKGTQDESYENPNARNLGSTENMPDSYGGEAPSYVNSQYVDTHGPKGKNLHEGFDDSGTRDGIQAAMNAKIGSKNDPSRLAENKFEMRNSANPRAGNEGKLSTHTNELLHLIIIHSIIVRGVKRGVRLRLVCKQFDDVFIPALFQTHILDSFSAPYIGWEWWSRKDSCGSIKLWHDYLVFRVLGERNPDVGRFMEIRNAGKALSHLSGDVLSLDETVQGLCWLALELGTNCPGERQLWLKGDGRECWVIYPDQYHPPNVELALERQSDSSQRTPPSNAQLDLLCGAAYFNLISVAEDLLQQNHDLSVRPSPPPISEASKCLHGQSLMDMCYHRAFSPTPTMYDFIMNTFPDIHDEDRRIGYRRRDEVARYARDGNLEMVRHLMSAGTKVHRGGFARLANPLYRACQGGYEDTVTFLLGRNAKYNGDVLFKAIRVGSLNILGRLLDHDATVHNEKDSFHGEVLSEIIRAEHTAILDLVLERGYIVTKERHEDAMNSAIASGLESMVEFLERINIAE